MYGSGVYRVRLHAMVREVDQFIERRMELCAECFCHLVNNRLPLVNHGANVTG